MASCGVGPTRPPSRAQFFLVSAYQDLQCLIQHVPTRRVHSAPDADRLLGQSTRDPPGMSRPHDRYSGRRTCAGSWANKPPITMNRAFIDRWTRMPHSIGRLSASASSHHNLSLAAFIINTAESDFRYTQGDAREEEKETGAKARACSGRTVAAGLGRFRPQDRKSLDHHRRRQRHRAAPFVRRANRGPCAFASLPRVQTATVMV